jgi:superfamily II DNA or RNA helicase
VSVVVSFEVLPDATLQGPTLAVAGFKDGLPVPVEDLQHVLEGASVSTDELLAVLTNPRSGAGVPALLAPQRRSLVMLEAVLRSDLPVLDEGFTAAADFVRKALLQKPLPGPGHHHDDPLSWTGLALFEDPYADDCVPAAAGFAIHRNPVLEGCPPLAGATQGKHARLRNASERWLTSVALRRSSQFTTGFELVVPDEVEGPWRLRLVQVERASGQPRSDVEDASIELTDIDDLNLFDDASPYSSRKSHDPKLLATYSEDELVTIRTELDLLWSVLGRKRSLVFAPTDFASVEKHVAFLSEKGYPCVLPGFWTQLAAPRTKVEVVGTSGTPVSESLTLTASASIDGEELTLEELARLESLGSNLARVGDRWHRVDAKVLARVKRLLARGQSGAPLSPSALLELDLEGADVNAEVSGWVSHVLDPDWSPKAAARAEVPSSVEAELRPYQQDALSWLAWLEDNDLGGILADDMGLGKTLTTLALVASDPAGPTLVVCPVGLVRNWAREAARFTPGLRVGVHHGAKKALEHLEDFDLVLTTPAMVVRHKGLRTTSWHRLVVDEAQGLKNPSSASRRAVAALNAKHRHLLTGTPVENHLGDLWSLVDLANPGLLGTHAAFKRRYVTSRAEEVDMASLARRVAPFMLRRKKTDPGVADELPEKITTREECALTPEQVTLYRARVAAMTSEELSAKDRFAVLFAGLTALKQICTNPALLLGFSTDKPLGEVSGKVARLTEVLEEVLEEGDAALVFTQYASQLPALAAHLGSALGVEVLTLSGADSPAKRQKAVDTFQDSAGPPVMVVSLKAGGTGLTLTRANHVLHLDRWWNPAVEDQASDRAWRIGQTKTVLVHNLVCPGTLEDRIDVILESKRELASSVVTSTSSLVTDLGAEELMALIRFDDEEAL